MDFGQLFSKLRSLRVLIVGDVMLDTYWWGHVDRISPEAPVPVVALQRKELRVGGAGNVALNTVSIGAETSIISVIGQDKEGEDLTALLHADGIDTSYLLTTDKRITTNKTRVMSRNQQMMRLDAEITNDLEEELQTELLAKVREYFKAHKPDVVILEDYNKGILTPRVIEEVIAICRQEKVITTVDPKRRNFFAYKGVSIFKPNLKEVKEGLNLIMEKTDLGSLQQMHLALKAQLQHDVSLITLSEKGIFYEQDQDARIIPTHIRDIADVSGAGDTVIAVASLVYAACGDMHLAAEMANIAGGLVCEEVGTAPISKERLMEECEILLGN